LRKKQYEKTEEEMLEIAKEIVLIKTKNQLNLLKNIRGKDDLFKKEIENTKGIISKIPQSENYESLL
jgi:CRISPR/Cas system-associated endonuclease Cas1